MENNTIKDGNEESKKMMALAGIKENDKKFLVNESFSEAEEKSVPEFITIKFEQDEVEPGEDDDVLYTLGK